VEFEGCLSRLRDGRFGALSNDLQQPFRFGSQRGPVGRSAGSIPASSLSRPLLWIDEKTAQDLHRPAGNLQIISLNGNGQGPQRRAASIGQGAAGSLSLGKLGGTKLLNPLCDVRFRSRRGRINVSGGADSLCQATRSDLLLSLCSPASSRQRSSDPG